MIARTIDPFLIGRFISFWVPLWKFITQTWSVGGLYTDLLDVFCVPNIFRFVPECNCRMIDQMQLQ